MKLFILFAGKLLAEFREVVHLDHLEMAALISQNHIFTTYFEFQPDFFFIFYNVKKFGGPMRPHLVVKNFVEKGEKRKPAFFAEMRRYKVSLFCAHGIFADLRGYKVSLTYLTPETGCL